MGKRPVSLASFFRRKLGIAPRRGPDGSFWVLRLWFDGFALSHHDHQTLGLFPGQVPPLPQLERFQTNKADNGAFEVGDIQSQSFVHLSDLVVVALT